MLFTFPNPAEVPLQIVAQNLDGTPKLDVASGTVRVFSLHPLGEVVVLSSTSLTATGASWRYVWEPVSLADGQYIVEFFLTDADGLTCMSTEDLSVRAVATESTLSLVAADVALIKSIESGEWAIVGNQMIFKTSAGVPIPGMTFNLFDDAGLPAMERVFRRVPA